MTTEFALVLVAVTSVAKKYFMGRIASLLRNVAAHGGLVDVIVGELPGIF